MVQFDPIRSQKMSKSVERKQAAHPRAPLRAAQGWAGALRPRHYAAPGKGPEQLLHVVGD